MRDGDEHPACPPGEEPSTQPIQDRSEPGREGAPPGDTRETGQRVDDAGGLVDEDGSGPPERPWLRSLGRAALVAGQAIGRGTLTAGRAVAAGYRAIDPDVRRQVAQLPLVGLTMLAPRQPPVEARPDDGARPIVCVHGLQGAAGNFAPLRAFLTVAGRSRSYAAWFESGGDVVGMTARLAELIREVIEVNQLDDDAQIDLVAHSLGGLIARLALLDPAINRRVHTLVTLGTPHHGTTLARLAATSHILSLRPSSPALEQLRHQLPWPGPPTLPRLVSLWSRADILLLPSSCAVVEGADNRELPELTHTGFLVHPTAFFAVLRALGE